MNTVRTSQGGFGPWRKSSFSNPNGNACVEVAFSPTAVGLCDSKNPDRPKLVFAHNQWLVFLADAATTD